MDHLWSPLKALMAEVDLKGKRVLDVGCWDACGASSGGPRRRERAGDRPQHAALVRRPRARHVQVRQEASQLAVQYLEKSVYDLESLNEQFDVVVFFGVLYHLRYPQLALARIRNVLKEGGSCCSRPPSCSTPTTR